MMGHHAVTAKALERAEDFYDTARTVAWLAQFVKCYQYLLHHHCGYLDSIDVETSR